MITGEKAIEILKQLKNSAKTINEYQNDILEDYRNIAEHEMRDMIEVLLNLEL